MLARICIVMSVVIALAACWQPVPSDDQQIIQGNLDDKQKEVAAESYVQAGFGHLRAGNLDIAKQRFERALNLVPGYYLSYMAFGLLYSRVEQYDLAEQSYAKALQSAPDNYDVLNNYGQFLCQRGNVDYARQLLLKSAEGTFNSVIEVPYTNLAVCMLEIGRKDEAKQYLLRALDANSGFAQALLPMAKLLYDSGSVVEASSYLQRFEAVANHSPVSLLLGAQIEKRLGNKDGVETYRLLLRKKFPASQEAQSLHSSDI